jgi:hypothetical protein
VGNDGETLVADSSTSTGLRYQATQAAGKNAVINGAMEVWQRGTSFTATGYTADRWYVTTPGSNTWSRSTDAPTGFNYSMNWVSAGSFPGLFNYVELPVTGQKGNFVGTWVYSFYAKASTATTVGLGIQWIDGSSRTNFSGITAGTGSVSLTTSWQRFSVIVDFNSSSPNGTNKAIEIGYFFTTGGATINITGCQLEVGSVATSFTRAGGTIQGELAACQRYYYRQGGAGNYQVTGLGLGVAGGVIQCKVIAPVTMRIVPNVLDFATLAWLDQSNAAIAATGLQIVSNQSSNGTIYLTSTNSTGVQYRPYDLTTNNSTAGYLGLGAEL